MRLKEFLAKGGDVKGIDDQWDKMSINERSNYIKNDLIRRGYTPAQTAAILGNLLQENTNLKTNTQNPKSKALGIAQWLGSRKKSIIAQGKHTSISGQLDFLDSEIKGNAWTNNVGGKKAFFKTNNVEDLTKIFRKDFERPGEHEANDAQRIKNAYAILGQKYTPSISSEQEDYQEYQGQWLPERPADMKLIDFDTVKKQVRENPAMMQMFSPNFQAEMEQSMKLQNEKERQEQIKKDYEYQNEQIQLALQEKQQQRNQILSMIPQSGSVKSGNIQAHLQKGGQVDKDKIYDNRDIQEVVIHPNNFQSIESDSLRVEKKMDTSLNLRNQKGNNQIKKDIIKDNTPWYIKGLAPTTTSKANNIYNELSEHYNIRNRRPVYTDESSSKLEKEIANKVNSQIGKYSNKELELRSRIKNAQQYGYIEGIGDLDKFVENIEQGKKQDLTNFKKIDNDNRQLRDALNSKYYGINEGDNHITESQYRPSKAKNNNTTYYDFHPNEKEKLLRDFVDNGIDYNFNNYVDQRQNSKGSIQTGNFYGLNQLNNYTLSGGEDKNGKYISYYDIWDLAGSGNKNIDESLNKINNPFEIYGRIYEKDLIDYKKRNKSKQSNKQK